MSAKKTMIKVNISTSIIAWIFSYLNLIHSCDWNIFLDKSFYESNVNYRINPLFYIYISRIPNTRSQVTEIEMILAFKS